MYLDEFCVALPFIEKSLYSNSRDIRSYVILNEIFIELLLKKLPLQDRVLSDAQCLNPLKRTGKFGPDRAVRLVEDVVDAMGEDNSKKLFDVKNEFSKHEIMDHVKFEYKCYQVENLPDGFYELSVHKDGNVNRNSRPSYWREAYNLLNIDTTQSESNYCGIDEYWWKVYLSVTSEANLSCLMFTKFSFVWCYFSEKRII